MRDLLEGHGQELRFVVAEHVAEVRVHLEPVAVRADQPPSDVALVNRRMQCRRSARTATGSR